MGSTRLCGFGRYELSVERMRQREGALWKIRGCFDNTGGATVHMQRLRGGQLVLTQRAPVVDITNLQNVLTDELAERLINSANGKKY